MTSEAATLEQTPEGFAIEGIAHCPSIDSSIYKVGFPVASAQRYTYAGEHSVDPLQVEAERPIFGYC